MRQKQQSPDFAMHLEVCWFSTFYDVFAATLDAGPADPGQEITDATEIETEGVEAIRTNLVEGPRRERILEEFRRYCAGESFREIEKATLHPRATISANLRAVETWMGKRFVRFTRSANLKDAIDRVTRVERHQGANAASVRDWHSLRATGVTLVLAAGV